MAFDYGPISGTAANLVERFGRAITLRKLAKTNPDPLKPWRGESDPRAAPFETLPAFGVFVDPGSERELGLSSDLIDWLPKAQQIAIVASQEDLQGFDELVDAGAVLWRVVGIKTLQPGAVRLVHFVGVAR